MSLQFILGGSGSGKSTYLYGKIIEAAARLPKKNFLVIVPEQFTMQTQRELVRLHPDHGLLNIDILSFQRLAHRIFEEVGQDRRTVLEDTGKTLLLRRAVSRKQDQLKILKNDLKKQGYLQEIKSLLSELTQYDIDEEKMERLLGCAAGKPALFYKLQDIRLLYDAFREELEGKYITAEETLEALCQVAERSAILRDSVIAFDGFTGFTPIQMKLLRELLRLAAQVTVTVTIDPAEDPTRIRGEHELFYLSKKTIRGVSHLAMEQQVEILPPVGMEWKVLPRFAKSPQLAFLEQHLFRSGKAQFLEEAENPQTMEAADTEKRKTKQKETGISLHIAANPEAEAHFAARSIRRLTRAGYRYQEIAVIVGDMASYADYLPRVFAKYGIPCFMDSTRSVFSNPLVEFIRAAFDMVQQDYSRVAVFRFLRTGLCRMAQEEIDLLENYVLAAGIRGASRWSRTFEKQPESITPEQLETCEALRARLMGPLGCFAKTARSVKTTVREKTEALYDLICGFDIQRQLAARAEEFRRTGQAELWMEYSRIYAIVMGLFDKLAKLLPEEKLTLREYTQILEAGLEETKVGIIPPAVDRVQVGDVERTRLKDVRALFFLGLNEGWVPAAAKTGGLLSDMERGQLMESGVELAPTARQASYIQRFYLYLNLTKPKERLYLSCCQTTADGALMRPSYMLRTVCRLFPGLSLQDEDLAGRLPENLLSVAAVLSFLADGLQKVRQGGLSAGWLELYGWCRRNADVREQAKRLVQAAFLTSDDSGIGREAARRLYGKTLAGSVSRLEKFASCAFAHFLQYGLRVEEREEYVFQPVDMGRIFHKTLELFSEKLRERGDSWAALAKEERNALTDVCVEEAAVGYGQGILGDNARNVWMVERMKRIMRRTVWALQRQIAAGRFVPADFEVSFMQAENLQAVDIPLTEREKIRLRGRIDRVDICERDGCVYVKVIDYKSGDTSFDLTAFYYGLQMQLMVYLNAAMELEKRARPKCAVVPAGIFYCRMKDPMLKLEKEETPEEIERRILRELCPDGLVNNDPKVWGLMDTENLPGILPITQNKDGSLSKSSKAVSGEQFEQLSKFAQKKIREIGEHILSGETAAAPYQRKQQTACDYCIYQSVCCRDPKIPGTRCRRVKEFADGEIWGLL